MKQKKLKDLMDIAPTVVVSHGGNCADGFGAAWACWKRWGDNVQYLFATHGEAVLNLNNEKILMTDFAYTRAEILELNENNKSLIILDHHLSAKKDLVGIEYAYFDDEQSGASLAWNYTHQNKELPILLQYVQDRDLRQWKMPYSKEILHVLDTLPKTFEAWDGFNNELNNNFDHVLLQGTIMHRKFRAMCERILADAHPIEVNGIRGMAVNAPWEVASYVADDLAEQANFGLSWFVNQKGIVKCSWRSSKGLDVEALAAHFGGGGHRDAAGSSITMEQLSGLLKSAKHRLKPR